MSARVLVTGASGFIGRHLLEELHHAGYAVRGLSRRTPTDATVEWFEGSVLQRDRLKAALRSCDGVVHLAARAHILREDAADPLAEFRAVNVTGAALVAEEAARAGVRHVVLLSSVAVQAVVTDEPVSEATPPAPTTPYGASKWEAEERARAICAATRTPLTILRPGMVFGPGMRGNPLRLFDLVARGIPLPVPAEPNRRSFLYVKNLTAAIRAVLETGAESVFMVADAEVVSTASFVREIARSLGMRPRLVPVPGGVLRLLGMASARLQALGLPLSAEAIERFTGSLVIDATHLRRTTGYRQPWELETAVRETAQWYLGRHS